jgi:hypothetical protein
MAYLDFIQASLMDIYREYVSLPYAWIIIIWLSYLLNINSHYLSISLYHVFLRLNGFNRGTQKSPSCSYWIIEWIFTTLFVWF